MKKYTYLEDGKTKADVITLESSDDVTVLDPETGDVLTWNGSDWINTEIPPCDIIDGGAI